MPLSLPRMDPPIGEDTPVAPPDLEGEAGAAIRPSLTSGYSKQFQKSLPPRFLRQQVLDWCCFIPNVASKVPLGKSQGTK